jgi:hypothetical protein
MVVKKKEEEFFPIMRCSLCPSKWKGTEKDKNKKVVRVISCKDTCVYLKLGEKE